MTKQEIIAIIAEEFATYTVQVDEADVEAAVSKATKPLLARIATLEKEVLALQTVAKPERVNVLSGRDAVLPVQPQSEKKPGLKVKFGSKGGAK